MEGCPPSDCARRCARANASSPFSFFFFSRQKLLTHHQRSESFEANNCLSLVQAVARVRGAAGRAWRFSSGSGWSHAMTDTGEKKYIKKKIRPGDIALDEHDPALVVQYELEGALFAPDGITVITELSAGRKRIKVKRMDSRTDLNALANEIVTGCKLIHSSKVGKVEALLVALRDRGMGADKNQKKNETKQELVRESNSNASSRAASRIEPATAQSARQSAQPTGTGRTNRALNVGTTGTKNTTRTSTKKPDDHYQKTLHTLKQNEEKRLLAEARGDFLGCLEASSALSEGLVSSGASRNGLVSGIGTSLQSLAGGVSSHGKARVEDIDLYLQKLYDDDVAVKGLFCGKIASLAQRVENLTTLVEHPTLPQTLARVLREEGRHSHEVSYGILSVFFALSNVKGTRWGFPKSKPSCFPVARP